MIPIFSNTGRTTMITSVVVVGAAMVASAATAAALEPHPVLAWLHAREGGFVSDKIAFENGGLFATQDITKGEKVMTIPKSSLVRSLDGEEQEMDCGLTYRIAYDYAVLKEKSEFWPYLQYLFETSEPQVLVPSSWSPEGKELVIDMSVTGFGTRSQDLFTLECFEEESYYEKRKPEEQSLQEYMDTLKAAFRIISTRGWNSVLVAVYDMANHRNNEWRNIDRDVDIQDDDDDYRVIALHDIPKGGELYKSLNQCRDLSCHGMEMLWITPHLLLDYGFVEPYPRRFSFETGFEDPKDLYTGLVVELDEVAVEGNKKQVQIKCLTKDPNENQLDWLQKESKRIFHKDIRDRAKQLESSYEANTIIEFYESIMTAMNLLMNNTIEEEDDNENDNEDDRENEEEFKDEL